jgi:hemerythrin-like domain-containing protein
MAKKVVLYLDDVAEKFSAMDILKTMRDHHRKMADALKLSMDALAEIKF